MPRQPSATSDSRYSGPALLTRNSQEDVAGDTACQGWDCRLHVREKKSKEVEDGRDTRPETTFQKELVVKGLPALTCAAEGEQKVLKQLHSAKPTGGSIRNIWVPGGQGSFCLQAVHWPDTSPRFSLGFLHQGREGGWEEGKRGRCCWQVPGRERCLLFLPTEKISEK